jgi:hypothetical protein
MPNFTRKDIRPGTDLHDMILRECRRYMRFSERQFQTKRKKWMDAENEMVAYVPESEADARRRSNRDRGRPSFTTIKVPYTYGVTMSAFAYLASVFLSRAPIFQFDGRHGESQMQCTAVEALIDYQYRSARMGPAMYSWIYDTAKNGTGIVGNYWMKDIQEVSEIVPIADEITGEIVGEEMVTTEITGYTGNSAFNVHARDFLPDPRVPIRDFQKGLYCGTRQRLSWLQIKQRERSGFYMNVDKISPKIQQKFSDDRGDDSSVERPTEDPLDLDMGYSDKGSKERPHPDLVPIYEVFVQLCPKDWNLGGSTYPTKWVFTVTADWNVVIGAQPFGAYHCRYPFSVNEMEPDAYALTNRGYPEINQGVQNSMDWLFNSHMYNVRAALNNLMVVDPAKVYLSDLTDPMPGGLIRLRPGARLTPGDAVQQLNVVDATRTHVSDMNTLVGIGERTHGVSDAMTGTQTKTGRRTATEIRSSNTAAAGRQKVTADYMSVLGFEDFAQQLLMNTQQYYDGEMKIRIVGDLAFNAGPKFLQVDPQMIAGFYDFVPIDGTMPLDRMAQVNLWKELLSAIMGDPNIAMQYDIGKIFAYVAQLAGIRNIDRFRIEVMQPGEMPGAGDVPVQNVTPMPASRNPNLLRQSPGMGPIPIGNLDGRLAA